MEYNDIWQIQAIVAFIDRLPLSDIGGSEYRFTIV